MSLEMQNHTHIDCSHHWYIRTRLQCGRIFMTRYAKSHTHILQSSMIHQNKVTMRPYLHDEICKITHTHILQSSLIHQNEVTMWPYLHNEICKITHTHRSCSQVIDLATRGHWISSISIDGLENWFLASNETTKLSNEGPIRATREGGGVNGSR
jgi:hypothetical protein